MLNCNLFNFSVVFCLIGLSAFGQQQFILPDKTPISPNAASFEKYGDIPVSLSNGLANISVPLFNVPIGAINISVQLSYHNNGLKVDEIPSWVGAGWNLSLGGVITYHQKGYYDFEPARGILMSPSKQDLEDYLNNSMSAEEKFNYMENIMEGTRDPQYDLYNYNFLGNSGSFYFDKNQQIISFPKNNLKITYHGDWFEIVDEKGNKFRFESKEYVESSPDIYQGIPNQRGISENSAFHLSSIFTVEGRTISFGYLNYPFSYYQYNSYINQFGISTRTECPTKEYVNYDMHFFQENLLLSTVVWDNGSLSLEHSQEAREDIKKLSPNANIPFVPYLKKIKLLNKNNEIINEYTFDYKNLTLDNRLQLKSVCRTVNSNSPEKWEFEYNGLGTPPLFTNARDHWGYYNGQENANSLNKIPNANYKQLTSLWTMGFFAKSNRESDFNSMLTGVLKKIHYPTGGATSFEYEPNQVTFPYSAQLPELGMFMKFDESSQSQLENIVVATTSTDAEVTGNFTLLQRERISILCNKTLDIDNRVESFISLSTTSNGPDIINSLLPYSCVGIGCISQGVITLEPGTYYYTVKRNIDNLEDQENGYAGLSIAKLVFNPLLHYIVGGLRIKKMTNDYGTGQLITKTYQYDDNIDRVIFRNRPNYVYTTLQTRDQVLGEMERDPCLPCEAELKINDESVQPLVGNPVEYIYVTEFTDEAGMLGKTEFTFTQSENLTTERGYPYVPSMIAKWRSGSVAEKKIYKKSNGVYTLLEQEDRSYQFTWPYESTTLGLKVAYFSYCDSRSTLSRIHSVNKENYQTERFLSTGSSVKTFNDNGSILMSNNFSYGVVHDQPIQVESGNSVGELVKTKNKYSFDYSSNNYTDDISLGINFLKSKNILAPIETISTKSIAGIDYVTYARLITYKSESPVPYKVLECRLNTPVLLSNFTVSQIDNSGIFIKDSRYEEIASFDVYDQYNNILQQKRKDNVIQSFLWDYGKEYLIAQVTNAANSDIAATSFEDDCKGNWVYSGTPESNSASLTGKKYYTLTGTNDINKSGLVAATSYIVSYWSKNQNALTINGTQGIPVTRTGSNGWKYFEHVVSGQNSVTITGSGIIDELRLYPKNSELTTYTYSPFIGIISKCDANNQVTYYEYDASNRLSIIRDKDKNVLKRICYNYNGQPVDCN